MERGGRGRDARLIVFVDWHDGLAAVLRAPNGGEAFMLLSYIGAAVFADAAVSNPLGLGGRTSSSDDFDEADDLAVLILGRPEPERLMLAPISRDSPWVGGHLALIFRDPPRVGGHLALIFRDSPWVGDGSRGYSVTRHGQATGRRGYSVTRCDRVTPSREYRDMPIAVSLTPGRVFDEATRAARGGDFDIF